MIKINLAARKKQALGSSSGATKISFDSKQLGAVLDVLKDLPIKKIVLAGAVGVLATILVDSHKAEQIAHLDEAVKQRSDERPKLQAEAGRMKGLEDLKKAMEADEFMIRTKLETIQKLVTDRSSSVKVLQGLVLVTPAEVWLTDFEVSGADIAIKGFSMDFAKISDLMKLMNESTVFRDLTLKDTQTAVDESKREIASFQIMAKKR